MKIVMLSIQPKWVEKIVKGEKTIEVRKSAPKEVPFKAYIYETKGATEMPWVDEDGHFIYKGRGQVIGEFVCDKVEKFTVGGLLSDDIEKPACLSYTEMINYFYKPEELDGNTAKFGYAWHISDLKIYDKPKPIMQFYKPCPIEIKNCPGCEFYSTNTGCCMNNIDRAPQSWCYVESLGE